MDDSGLTPATQRKDFIADTPEFPVEIPMANPFLIQTAITFRESGEESDSGLTCRNVAPTPESRTSEEISDSIVERRRRDLARFPNSIRARVNLGAALLAHGRLDEASHHLSQALALDPDHCVAIGTLARVRLLEGRLEEAKELYLELGKRNPSDVSALIGLAQIAVRLGNLGEGVSLLQDAAKHPANRTIAKLHLSIVLLQLKRTREAIASLRAASREDVRWPSIYEALGIAYLFNGRLRKAEKAFRTSLALFPDGQRALHGLAEVLYRLRDFESAIAVLENVLVKYPDDVKAREILARVFGDEHEYKHARQQLISAEPFVGKTSPYQLSRIQNNIGVCTSMLDQIRTAGQWFTRSIESAPVWNPIPYLNAARLNIQLGKLDAAASQLQLCRLQFPKAAPEAVTLLAMCLSLQGKEDDAIRELHRVIETGDAPVHAYSFLGFILADKVRNYRGAAAILEEGYRKYCDDPVIANNLAYAYIENGEPERARPILESIKREGREADASDVYLTATWGLLKLWEGDLTGCERNYRESEKLARRLQDGILAERVRQKMHLELARYYHRSGDSDRALDEIARGLKFTRPTFYRDDLEELRTQIEKSKKERLN